MSETTARTTRSFAASGLNCAIKVDLWPLAPTGAMLKKFLSRPRPAHQDTGKFLTQLLDRNTQDSCFEGMLEIGLALAEKGVVDENLSKMIALSAVAENRYDIAKPWIEKHGSESKKPLEILGAIYVNLDNLTRDWAEELRLREEDEKANRLPQVSLMTTKGEIVIELFENQAPETGCQLHLLGRTRVFYNGQPFHRVLSTLWLRLAVQKVTALAVPAM